MIEKSDETIEYHGAIYGRILAVNLANARARYLDTVTADEDDDTAGYIDVDTGFGKTPDFFYIVVRRSGVSIFGDQIITTRPNGTIRVAGGKTFSVKNGDVITVYAAMFTE